MIGRFVVTVEAGSVGFAVGDADAVAPAAVLALSAEEAHRLGCTLVLAARSAGLSRDVAERVIDEVADSVPGHECGHCAGCVAAQAVRS